MLEDLLKGEFMQKGEPFYNKASKDLGVLMFHGITATPNQVREIGDFLYKKGISNFGFCVAGHGTKKEDLMETTRKDWLDSVRNAYQEFNKVYEKTIILGFSMGGLLALNLGKEYKPDGIIIVATPYRLNYRGNLLTMLGLNKKHIDASVGYKDAITPKMKYEIIVLTKETRKAIPHIESPILIIQGTKDRRVSKKSPYQIYDKVKSKHKELLILPEEQHMILNGKYKKGIFNKVHDFVLQC